MSLGWVTLVPVTSLLLLFPCGAQHTGALLTCAWFQCSSLYEECYILPSQQLSSQLGSHVQETHPLLVGEWKVSNPLPEQTLLGTASH